MNVITMKPVSLGEAKELAKSLDEKKPLHDYLNNFSKVSATKSVEFAEQLRDLKNVKLNEENIVKIVDFVPRTPEEVHKVCNNVSLEEKEVTEILDIARKY